LRADLARRYRLTPVHGRPATPAEVLLRLLVVKHLYGWSFEETERRVTDSLVLRWFCRVVTTQSDLRSRCSVEA
jgi:transposase, IS5 family